MQVIKLKKRDSVLLAALIGLFVLAACGGRSEPPPVVTVTPIPTTISPATLPPSWTPGPSPTRTPVRNDMPPTWTPRPARDTVTPIPFVAGTERANRQPTVTPAGVMTATPGAFTTLIPVPPTLVPDAVYPAVCKTFARAEPIDQALITGQPAHLSWTPIEGAQSYQVFLLNPGKRYSFAQIYTETAITIEAANLPNIGTYGWEIVPLKDGVRFCGSLTGVFVVRLAN